MRNKFKVVMLMIMVLGISACSFESIPPASKGKVLTTSGYNPETLPPGKYTIWGRDQMIILKTNTNTYKETIKVILDDKLTLFVDVRFRGRIAGSDPVIDSMFNDIEAGSDNTVEFNEVYRIYGQPTIRNRTRAILSQYTVEDVHKNYARLSKEIGKSIQDGLKGTPIEVSDVALGDIKYPELVTKAIEQAKARDLEIKKEEANAKIALVKKKNERLLAEADYQIKLTKAKAIRDSNKIIGEGITPALLKLRALEVQEAMAENKSAVFMPYEAFSSEGAKVRMYNSNTSVQ